MKKHWTRSGIMNAAGFALLISAAAVSVVVYLLRYDQLWLWYNVYQEKLLEAEQFIQSLGISWKFVLTMLIVFLVRTFIPFLAVSAICVLTGAVLPSYWALIVNFLGIIIMMSIKYFEGMKFGSGNAWKIISKNERARKIIESSGKVNKALLFALRLIPGFPLGSVSRIYGSLRFPYWRFILLSAAGFAPKLLSYTFMGTNVFDPLSSAFLVPLMIVLTISGASLLCVNLIWLLVEKSVSSSKKNKDN
ncbi:MAG: VTT domain-containing protein [Acutalibacteraceae bacterium]|nr:VTT domain-containing protein [Acutalibacteraceae bacterium]